MQQNVSVLTKQSSINTFKDIENIDDIDMTMINSNF
jgi:hypothetical protein